ncbi:hypothetical protein RFI_26793, partial [Reticulomyxa filosa]
QFVNSITARPVLALGLIIGGYYYVWKWPLQKAEEDRFERWRNSWENDVMYQQTIDWSSRKVKQIWFHFLIYSFKKKKERNEMKEFITKQINRHGSLEAAVRQYEKKTGKKAPPILLNDPVLDHAFARVGVPVVEPSFLWDGTAYLGDENKPAIFTNGKIRLPQAPRYYFD